MRNCENSKTIAQVSQEAGYSGEVGQGQHFVSRLSIHNAGRWTITCMQRACMHYFAAIPMRFDGDVRIGPVLETKTTNLCSWVLAHQQRF